MRGVSERRMDGLRFNLPDYIPTFGESLLVLDHLLIVFLFGRRSVNLGRTTPLVFKVAEKSGCRCSSQILWMDSILSFSLGSLHGLKPLGSGAVNLVLVTLRTCRECCRTFQWVFSSSFELVSVEDRCDMECE